MSNEGPRYSITVSKSRTMGMMDMLLNPVIVVRTSTQHAFNSKDELTVHMGGSLMNPTPGSTCSREARWRCRSQEHPTVLQVSLRPKILYHIFRNIIDF